MAWVTPTNVATGDVLTASKWNQDVVANGTAIGGAWSTYTPTWTNVTVGNATQTFRYLNAGKLYVVRFAFTWGSTTSASGVPSFTLPDAVSLNATYDSVTGLGVGHLYDVTGNAYTMMVTPTAATFARVTFAMFRSDGTFTFFAGPDATSPVTWTNGDRWAGQFMFEAA